MSMEARRQAKEMESNKRWRANGWAASWADVNKLLAHIMTLERAVAEAKEHIERDHHEIETYRHAPDYLAQVEADLSSARRALAERDAELLGTRQAFDDCDRIACREKDRADALTSTLAEVRAQLNANCIQRDALQISLAEAHAALKKEIIRLGILSGRMAACDKEPQPHPVSAVEIPGWIAEIEALLTPPASRRDGKG